MKERLANMNWFDTFAENLKIFWNQPVPIIGFTIGTVAIFIIIIISKTSIGKKSLHRLEKLINKSNNDLNIAKHSLDDATKEIKKFAESKEQEIIQLTKDYEDKLSAYKHQLNNVNSVLEVVCSNSHNVNIQKAYKDYKQVEINDLYVSERLKKADDVIEIYEKNIEYLQRKIEELEKKVGNTNGEQPKDSETTSE